MKKTELLAYLQAEIATHGDGEVSEEMLKMVPHLTEDDQIQRGKLIAEVLKLRKDSEHKDRYQTTWGSKTALGVYASIRRIVMEGE